MGMGYMLQPGFVRWAPASQNHFNHCTGLVLPGVF